MFFPTSGKIFKSVFSSLFLLRLSRQVKFIVLPSVFQLSTKMYNFYVVLARWGLFCKNDKCWGWNLRRPRSFPAPSLLFLRLGVRYSEQNISKKEEKLRA